MIQSMIIISYSLTIFGGFKNEFLITNSISSPFYLNTADVRIIGLYIPFSTREPVCTRVVTFGVT
jgi:hypothetical protein